MNKSPAYESPLLHTLFSLLLTPVSIRRSFLLLTRLHYSDPANYGGLATLYKDYIWNKDAKIRKLQVDYDYNYDPKNVDRRPAIYVGLDDINYRKVVIGNNAGFTEDRSGEQFIKSASTRILIRHIGLSSDDSLAMADLTAQFFLGITPMIRDSLGPRLMEYDVVTLKSSRPFEKTSEQANQNFISDVVIAFSYNAIWLSRFESHRIKTISFEQSMAELSLPTVN